MRGQIKAVTHPAVNCGVQNGDQSCISPSVAFPFTWTEITRSWLTFRFWSLPNPLEVEAVVCVCVCCGVEGPGIFISAAVAQFARVG